MSQTILVLDHEEATRDRVVSILRRSGFSVAAATSSDEAERILERIYPCLILLSRCLPGPGPSDFAHWLNGHERACAIPIIALVPLEEVGVESPCSTSNVVDTLAAPVCERNLVGHVKTALGLTTPVVAEEALEFDGLKLDPVAHRVSGFGEPIELDRVDFRMLYFFMRNPNRCFTRSQLLDSVWGRNVYAEESVVEVHVAKLRKALAPVGLDLLIQTVNGSDFRLSSRSA